MSLLISTRVPAKWTKEYKSGKRVTSLKIEAQLPLNFHNSKQPAGLARSIILTRNSFIRIIDSTRVPGLISSFALIRSNFTVWPASAWARGSWQSPRDAAEPGSASLHITWKYTGKSIWFKN